jgi:hypothetical protein
MHCRYHSFPVFALLFVSLALPALAQLPPAYARCADSSTSPQEKIEACTWILRSGQANGRNLAITHFHRGTAYGKQGNHDQAVADFTEATLDAKYAPPVTGRGLVYEKKGEINRAKLEFNRALGLPLKCGASKWAHETATQRLAVLAGKHHPPFSLR